MTTLMPNYLGLLSLIVDLIRYVPAASTLNSPRARRTKVERSDGGFSNTFPINSAIRIDGRRSPFSILRSMTIEHPTLFADSPCASLR